MSIVLPTSKSAPKTRSPKNLIIFSKPKTGKTELCAALPNWLLLDLEKGSDFVEAMTVQASTYKQILEIGKAVKASEHKYDGIIVDTVTALEEIALPLAEQRYANTSMGVNWFIYDDQGKLTPTCGKAKYKSVINLPNGAGY